MSNLVSQAQALPGNILRRIILYSAAGNAALNYIWRDLQLTIAEKEDTISVNIPEDFRQPNFPHYAVGHVRKLDIFVSMPFIIKGIAYRLLTEYLGNTKVLPVSNRLHIWITDCGANDEYLRDNAISNVPKFAQLLISLTPAETMTTVTCASIIKKMGMLEEECFGAITSILHDRSKRFTLDLGYVNLEHKSTIDTIPQLSSLTTFCGNLHLHESLVHKCANSLLDLTIGVKSAKMMFYDVDNNVVVYPYLKRLKLKGLDYGIPIARASGPNVVTLPSLIELIMPTALPFNDDVLFRGNCATLRRVEIWIDQHTVEVLSRTREFGNKHINMNLKICKPMHPDDLSLVSDADISRFIRNFVEAASVLTLSHWMPVGNFVAAAPPTHGFESLRKLSVIGNWLSFSDVLSVIKVLPNLVTFDFGISGMGPELADIADEDLPNHIASTYSNAGKNLQVWLSQSTLTEQALTIPKYAMLMALVCPKLCRVEVVPNNISDFQTRVYEELQSGPFSKYASQLNRLLQAAY